ncbi:MAG: lysophospholipid acyltransferase family protein [Gemmatimonadota bacterium]|nr:lysophospholipid acyltransferase family protein [Gemmatimonadota bacterium]MDH3422864.1 lysophospholipid acyltransferase family protein [Gemmatimonadota bacterium]
MTLRALRHRAEDLALRGVAGLWSLLPEATALRVGAAMGVLVGGVLRIRRRDVDRHLGWAFPDRPASWRRSVARASYAHLGREAVVMFRAGGWSAERVLERTQMVGFGAFREAARSGNGLVLLTGHIGNWEIGGAAIAARGVPFDVVGKGMSNRGFQSDLFAARERFGMRVIEMGDAARAASRSLRQGRVVALLGDQHAHSGGIPVPFFGRPAQTTRGPALLVGGTGAPVWIAFAARDPGPAQRYTVTFEPLHFTPTGRADEDAEMLMAAYARVLEEAIRATPEQYFWLHRRWKEPGGEEPGLDG